MTKPFVKIIRDHLGHLREKKTSDVGMYILGGFLTDDVVSDTASIRDMVLDGTLAGGNFSDIVMQGENVKIMEEWPAEGNPYIELTKEQLMHILDEWEKAYKKDTKEILITREQDGSFTFEVIK